jgi:hypothetical protein
LVPKQIGEQDRGKPEILSTSFISIPPNEQAGEVRLAIRFVMIGAPHNFD